MENLTLSFSVVCPLFLLMTLGYFLRLIGCWDEPFVLKLNQISFYVFFSSYLFISVYHTDISQSFNPRLMIYVLCAVLVAFAIATLQALAISKDHTHRSVIAQGIARSNTLLFGLPVVVALCGEEHTGEIALIIATIVPLYNLLSVFVLEMFRGGKMNFGRMIRQVATNPLIIGALLGVVLVVLGIRLPAVIDKTVSDIAKVASPLALMILGGTFRFGAVQGNLMALLMVCLSKLVLMPLIFVGGGILLGLRGVELAVLLAVFATPTAASSFTMAEQMGGDYELAGQIVVFTTAFSVITMFGWVFVLLQTGLIPA